MCNTVAEQSEFDRYTEHHLRDEWFGRGQL
jgi:hypothetical protein